MGWKATARGKTSGSAFSEAGDPFDERREAAATAASRPRSRVLESATLPRIAIA